MLGNNIINTCTELTTNNLEPFYAAATILRNHWYAFLVLTLLPMTIILIIALIMKTKPVRILFLELGTFLAMLIGELAFVILLTI